MLEQVDAFHAAALAAGERDNGPPGVPPEYSEHYYGAFVLDRTGITSRPFTTAGPEWLEVLEDAPSIGMPGTP